MLQACDSSAASSRRTVILCCAKLESMHPPSLSVRHQQLLAALLNHHAACKWHKMRRVEYAHCGCYSGMPLVCAGAAQTGHKA